MIDWWLYRQCRVCHASMGKACTSQSGRIVAGRPDGARRELAQPHTVRRLRAVPKLGRR